MSLRVSLHTCECAVDLTCESFADALAAESGVDGGDEPRDFILYMLDTLLRVESIEMGVTNPVERYMSRYRRDVVM